MWELTLESPLRMSNFDLKNWVSERWRWWVYIHSSPRYSALSLFWKAITFSSKLFTLTHGLPDSVSQALWIPWSQGISLIQQSPLIWNFFRSPVNCGPEGDDPFSDSVRRLTLHHNAYVTHITLSHHIGILSPHIITRGRRGSTIQYILRERPYLHNFIKVYCYNCFYFITVDFLLCLINK